MEQDIMKKADQLYIQKQQADATLLSIGDGVVSTDQAGSIVAFNKVAGAADGLARRGRHRPIRSKPVFRLVNEASREERHESGSPRRSMPATRSNWITMTDAAFARRQGIPHRRQRGPHHHRRRPPDRRRPGLPRRHREEDQTARNRISEQSRLHDGTLQPAPLRRTDGADGLRRATIRSAS
ncbi:MAG: hypothetical protein MZU97_14695 [Bacillus subtilis]|nr:hypothetical protein [Bacillus subtilis]